MRRFLLVTLLAFSLAACGRAAEREASKVQQKLNEAELLMDGRLFKEAADMAERALIRSGDLSSKYPGDIDIQILQVRAHMTRFMANNAVIIENAEPQPRSLVTLPKFEDYVGFEGDVMPSQGTLTELANGSASLTADQSGYVHGTLGAIFRLRRETLIESEKSYGRAIDIYKQHLLNLKNEEKKVGSNEFAILQTENQIRSLQLAQAEVSLLANEWRRSLKHLEDMMAGKDLEYFEVQFKLLEGQIASLENTLRLQEENPLERGGMSRIVASVKKRTAVKQGALEQLGGRNPYRVQLAQARLMRAEKQNNLMYRIICMWNLQDQGALNEAREVLRSHYPELENELVAALSANR